MRKGDRREIGGKEERIKGRNRILLTNTSSKGTRGLASFSSPSFSFWFILDSWAPIMTSLLVYFFFLLHKKSKRNRNK